MMNDPANAKLIVEIRDLLSQQNQLIADIKAQNAEHIERAEAIAVKQIAQQEMALGEVRANAGKAGRAVWIIAAVVVVTIVFFSWRS